MRGVRGASELRLVPTRPETPLTPFPPASYPPRFGGRGSECDRISPLLLDLFVCRSKPEWLARIFDPLVGPRFQLGFGLRVRCGGRAFCLLFLFVRSLRIHTPERGRGTLARILCPPSDAWQHVPARLVPLLKFRNLDDELVLLNGPIHCGDRVVEDFEPLAELLQNFVAFLGGHVVGVDSGQNK